MQYCVLAALGMLLGVTMVLQHGVLVGACVHLALYMTVALLFAIPQIRRAVFKSKYSHCVASTIVLIPYILMAPFLVLSAEILSIAAFKR